jgi:hypothetical protein
MLMLCAKKFRNQFLAGNAGPGQMISERYYNRYRECFCGVWLDKTPFLRAFPQAFTGDDGAARFSFLLGRLARHFSAILCTAGQEVACRIAPFFAGASHVVQESSDISSSCAVGRFS